MGKERCLRFFYLLVMNWVKMKGMWTEITALLLSFMKTDVRKYCIQTVENESVLMHGENTSCTVKNHTSSLCKTSALNEFWFNVITLLIIYKVAQYIFS